MTIDLSEFLPKKGSLDEFLASPSKPAEPKDILSAPEQVVLFWHESHCKCGRIYQSEAKPPMIRHTVLRTVGFGRRPIAKIFIPVQPNEDVSDLPIKIETTHSRMFACIECIGQRPSLPLFADSKPDFIVNGGGDAAAPHLAAWYQMHATANHKAVDQTLLDMKRRADKRDLSLTEYTDSLLLFKTHESDLRSLIMPTCDPEAN